MMRAREARAAKVKDRSDPELRSIALGVHAGRIITNAQSDESTWRQYVLTQRPLIVEFKRLSVTDRAKVKKLTKQLAAWEKGSKMVRTGRHLKS